jgi:tetratricopeptide (TPR) repeat protein
VEQTSLALRHLCTAFSVVLLAGCASWFAKRPDEALIRERRDLQNRDFGSAASLLDAGKYREAEVAFEEFLRKHPTSDLEFMAYFNLGAAAEGQSQCQKAVDMYRKILRGGKNKNTQIEAQAMFRLSYAYECLKDDAKVIASLRDLEARRGMLSDEMALAEWPARLAAAYARSGNRDLAERYFRMAEGGLKDLNSRTRDPQRKKELLARTLFFMGSMERQRFDPRKDDAYLRGVGYLQAYLLKSVELETEPWSSKASAQILNLYQNLLGEINSTGAGKISARRDLAEQGVAGLVKLRNQRFPDDNEPKSVQQLFAQVEITERQFRMVLSQLEERAPLTPESKSRRSIQRPGVVRGERSELERAAPAPKKAP